MSNVKILVLMAGLTALFIAIGGAIGGQSGMTMALVLAVAINFISYYASSAAPLAIVNPLAAYGGGIIKLFSTHPPTAERVARLELLARAA